MPTKRRRLTGTNRRTRKTTQEESRLQLVYLRALYERNLEKSDSDIQTIPDHTFGKVYSTQIVSQSKIIEEKPSSNASSMMEPEMIVSSVQKSRKRKTNKRKLS